MRAALKDEVVLWLSRAFRGRCGGAELGERRGGRQHQESGGNGEVWIAFHNALHLEFGCSDDSTGVPPAMAGRRVERRIRNGAGPTRRGCGPGIATELGIPATVPHSVEIARAIAMVRVSLASGSRAILARVQKWYMLRAAPGGKKGLAVAQTERRKLPRERHGGTKSCQFRGVALSRGIESRQVLATGSASGVIVTPAVPIVRHRHDTGTPAPATHFCRKPRPTWIETFGGLRHPGRYPHADPRGS
jgi:hypothetical protein